jgi:RNA polymerase sigma-70 factor (ECF subfamily)
VAEPEKPTEEIVRELKQGRDRDENARRLYKRYYHRVSGFFRSQGILPEDCEELTDDVFISVYTKLGELRQDSKFENWVCRIAMNVYRNELKRRGARKRATIEVPLEEDRESLDDLHPSVGLVVNPESQVLEQEKLDKVREALQALPLQMRRCLLLRVDNEMSYEEIALIMGLSVNTVSAHLHQARRILKETLSRYFANVGL